MLDDLTDAALKPILGLLLGFLRIVQFVAWEGLSELDRCHRGRLFWWNSLALLSLAG